MRAAVDRFGGVDILVLASGKNDVAKITDMSPDRFLDVMDANVTQSGLMARAAGKRMLAQARGVSLQEISRQTTENFFRLFSKVPRPEAA